MRFTGHGVLILFTLAAGCGGADGDDAGGGSDAPSGDCAGAADGASCGTGEICVAGTCGPSRCGDGFLDVGGGEVCDDGNELAFDGCEPITCRFTCDDSATCDDGVTCNGAEECTGAHQCAAGTPLPDATACTLAGGASGVCRSGECVVPGCGDGLVMAGESCDDGNDVDGDGCESSCRFTCEVEPGATQTWFLDCDGDGYAAEGAGMRMACPPPEPMACGGGWTLRAPVPGARDCDDVRPDVRPGATEVCDGVDQDCDMMADDGVLITFFRDVDGDLHGDAASTMMACTAPTGFVATSDDCDDGCASCLPGGTETCDLRDNDCDGTTDEGVLTTFFRDTDGDTYGNTASTIDACAAPPGYVSRDGDCDDGDSGAFPGQTMFLTRMRMSGGYDFNCDGVATRQFTAVAPATCSCACPVGFCCAGMCAGWIASAPSCGGSGTWRETGCTCGLVSTTRVQGCH